MLSRVAESIYWMGRQVERAENLARFLEVTHNLTLDQPEETGEAWGALIAVTADSDLFQSRYDQSDPEAVTRFLAFDDAYPSSMISSLRSARST